MAILIDENNLSTSVIGINSKGELGLGDKNQR
jgi:hypothetical protein